MSVDTDERLGGVGPVETGLGPWLRRLSPQDLASTAAHSGDFNGLRAEYVYLRIRLLAFGFALAAPLWIPIDLLFLPAAYVGPFLALRLLFSAGYLGLGLWMSSATRLSMARTRVFLFFTISGLFYVASRVVTGDGLDHTGILSGYTFLPFLSVALLAIFPLTLLEGIAAALYIGAFYVGVELWFGTLFSIPSLGDVWLMGLLAVVAVWAELSQLHMLLRLYREATRDPLTGLVNRRVLSKWLSLEVERAREREAPLSVLLFDLDLFKRINDEHGHLAGDAVLRAFGALLAEELHGRNLIGRYGGEEFLAMLPGYTGEQAREIAERIRGLCRGMQIRAPGTGTQVNVTVSIGVAALRPEENAEGLLSRVDSRLYQAKESGRDMVVSATDVDQIAKSL